MGRRRQGEPPSYRLHKQSGQAVVSLPLGNGTYHDVLLGKHGSPESRQEYARVIAEWEASGRQAPVSVAKGGDLTVNELILRYFVYAEGYYRKNGEPTSQLHRIRQALRVVKELYGHTLAAAFGPLALKAVRGKMLTLPCGMCRGTGQTGCGNRSRKKTKKQRQERICGLCKGKPARGWARGLVNSSIGCIKRMFKWAVAEELVPSSVYHGLQSIEGLRKGRSTARETRPVRPVVEAHVDAVLPELTSVVRAMVQVQRFTGMRPGELVELRPCDIDRTTGKVWTYRPWTYKTEHHEAERVIFVGPRAQRVLEPFLAREPQAYCFSPRESLAEFRIRQRKNRQTKVQPSQANRRKAKPNKGPGDHYSVDTYGNAIERACIRAGIPPWHPHQMRHSKATEIRKADGLDAARAVMGHRSPAVTEVYAEVDMDKAAQVMERLG